MNEMDTLTRAADEGRFASIEALRGGQRKTLRAGFDAARARRMMELARATGRVLDEGAERAEAQAVLDYWATKLATAGEQVPDDELLAFDPALRPTLADAQCPYLGLRAFEEADRGRFFGREGLVDEMLRRVAEPGLLVVTGPSGSGKSSAVLAGLLPRLREDAIPGSSSCTYYPVVVPGVDPLAALSAALAPGGADGAVWAASCRARLAADAGHLARVLGERERAAVLVVDQGEELVTLGAPAAEARAFVANLERAAGMDRPRAFVVLTVRSDFVDRVLGKERDGALEILTQPLGPVDLVRAIEEPARLVGLRFMDGIVADLVRQVEGEPAALPLLQFTLLRLWETRAGNRITWEAYRELGGNPRTVLLQAADQFYGRDLLPEDQLIVERIFLAIVKPAAGQAFTRRRVRREYLHELGPRDAIDRVLERLVAAHLLRVTPGETPLDDRIDLTHESLVRNWPRLAGWLGRERQGLEQRLQLAAAAEIWRRTGEDDGALIGGRALEETAGKVYDDPGLERFLAASRAYWSRRAKVRARFVSGLVAALASGLIVVVLMFFQMRSDRDAAEAAAADARVQSLLVLREQNRTLAALNEATRARLEADRARRLAEDRLAELDLSVKQVAAQSELVLARRVRPLRPGASVGALGGNEAGSLCCFVRDGAGRTYLVTTAHLVALGDRLAQPGPLDGGGERDGVATVTFRGPDEILSLALAEVQRDVKVTAEIEPGLAITGLARAPQVGDEVLLFARNSGRTKGTIEAVAADVIYTTRLSQPGDSGGPVVDDTGALVGMLVGRSADGERSIVLPLGAALRALGVEVVAAPAPRAPGKRAGEPRQR